MKWRRLLFLAAAVASPAAAQECYPVNAERGSVSFEVSQAGSPFRGSFRRFGGEICLAQDSVTRLDVWLEPASVEAGMPEIDAALKDKEFFDTARHPRIAFVAASTQARGGRQHARGSLEIKGTRREVEIPFALRRDGNALIVSGTLTLDRLEYGIGTGEWSDTKWLGRNVKVDFNATLTAGKKP